MALALLALGRSAAFGEAAAGLPPEAQALQSKADALKSYRAQFILEAREEDGQSVRLEGKLLFEGPNRRRVEIKEEGSSDASQILVGDGKLEWQYFKEANTVYRQENPPQPPGPHRPFAEIQDGTLRAVAQAPAGTQAIQRFEGKPVAEVTEGAPVPIETIRVDVGTEDGLARELTLLDAQGKSVLSQRYSQVEVNLSFPEGTFAFTPPADAAVVDLNKELTEGE
ncbi:MAG: outer membrane lipoprotein carrier protein LolA [Candidatus Omnitrophica bacterium]|nr:outer membrane lipoprotein carrier protein LolA [Candidatus Omnitrophota bacterium]